MRLLLQGVNINTGFHVLLYVVKCIENHDIFMGGHVGGMR